MSERRGLFRPYLVRGASRTSAVTPAPDQAERFRAVMLPHLDAAWNLARWLAPDPATAEDVVQETFLRAFRAFDSWQGGSPRAWLFAILRNCWRDRAGADGALARVMIGEAGLSEAQAAAVDAVPDEAETAEAMLIRGQEIAMLRETIAAIPEPFREALVLREMEQMLAIGTGGHALLSPGAAACWCPGRSSFTSISRARARRDITVPIGTPVIVAISR